jgi:hypothetical protein
VAEPQDEFGGVAASARQFEATKREAATLVAGLNDAQLNWKLNPRSWSVGQCLMHLARGTDAVLPAIDRAISKAKEKGWPRPAGPVRFGWMARMMVGSMEPPPKRIMKTWPMFEPPTEVLRGDEVIQALNAARDRILERTRQAEALDYKRAIVVSPVSWMIRIPLGGYLAFLAAHDRRHLYQAQQVKAAPGFGTN